MKWSSLDPLRKILPVVLFAAVASLVYANPPNPGSGGPTSLDYWPFDDTTTWKTDLGYLPISFTNLNSSQLGNGMALVVDSGSPAWLNYNVVETSGTNELTVSLGTVLLWFAPNWASANQGGTGPGQWGRLIDVGASSINPTNGWWSIYLDPWGTNVYFGAQTNNSAPLTYLSAPISWTSNRWHMVALTYSSTNSTLYLDGALATNGLAVTKWPNQSVLTNGFFIGSDSSGVAQAHGMFDDISTYNVVLDSTNIYMDYRSDSFFFYMNPMNRANLAHGSYPPDPGPTLSAITGAGFLQQVGTTTNCISSSSIWFTNATSVIASNQTENMTFTIEGGSPGVAYDVFANALLGPSTSPAYQWAWMGQGYQCTTYTLTNLPIFSAFLIMGTPQDSDADGLTDAFENLVSHTNPYLPNSLGDGLSDLYKVLHGLSLTNLAAVPSLTSISIPTCPIQ